MQIDFFVVLLTFALFELTYHAFANRDDKKIAIGFIAYLLFSFGVFKLTFDGSDVYANSIALGSATFILSAIVRVMLWRAKETL